MPKPWEYLFDVSKVGLDPSDAATLRRLQRLAYLLDDRFRIPGLRYRVGIDGLIGLIPGIGDAASAAIASYIVYEALRLGVPKAKLAQMMGNVGIDFLVGSVPLIGDLLDVGFKASRRNVSIILRHLEEEQARGRRPHAPAAEVTDSDPASRTVG